MLELSELTRRPEESSQARREEDDLGGPGKEWASEGRWALTELWLPSL